MNNSSITGIILAGGKATRLDGRDKGLLVMKGQPLIARKIEQLRSVGLQILIVTNTPQNYRKFDEDMIPDLVTDIGPIGGIFSGLTHSQTHLNFITAVDMPYFSETIFQALLKATTRTLSPATLFEHSGGIEPLFALYSKDCIPIFDTFIHQKRYRLSECIHALKGLSIPISTEKAGNLFVNVNTAQDLGVHE